MVHVAARAEDVQSMVQRLISLRRTSAPRAARCPVSFAFAFALAESYAAVSYYQMLHVAENTTGYFGVYLSGGQLRPYQARLRRGGKDVHLGYFATAEEAALCVARSPEGQAAAEKAAAAAPLTSEEARQQAQAEGLMLRVADNTAGYFGVHLSNPGYPKPFQAKVSRGGKRVHLGSFATAEEAALCVARSPEGQAAAEKAAAAGRAAEPPLTSEEAQQQARDAVMGAAALDIIYEAAGAATAELSAEVAAEVMAGIAMGLLPPPVPRLDDRNRRTEHPASRRVAGLS